MAYSGIIVSGHISTRDIPLCIVDPRDPYHQYYQSCDGVRVPYKNQNQPPSLESLKTLSDYKSFIKNMVLPHKLDEYVKAFSILLPNYLKASEASQEAIRDIVDIMNHFDVTLSEWQAAHSTLKTALFLETI